jgi:hypothetical protein
LHGLLESWVFNGLNIFWTFIFLFKYWFKVHNWQWSGINYCWGRRGGTTALMGGTATLLVSSRCVEHICIEYVSGNWCCNSLGILLFIGLFFLWPNVANCQLLNCLTRWILLSYNTCINLLYLRAIRFIKCYIYRTSTLPVVLLKTR